MQESATYSQLKELFEEHFSNNSSTFNKDEFITLLIGETAALKKLSEASNIPVTDLNAFRTDCIEYLADEHYNEALLDAFVKLVIDSDPFKTHISFLEELNTGVQSLERASRLNELKELEDSIEASELKAAITSIERNELLEQLKRTEAKIEESEVRMHASSAHMYEVEELNIPSSRNIFSNRSMFLRIAAILLLVLIPTSIIIYFNNSNPVTAPEQIQTAEEDTKQDILADPDLKDEIPMGSSPKFSLPNGTKIPDARIERSHVPVIDEESFGFASKVDSIEIEYQFFEVQNEYIETRSILFRNEIRRLDSILLKEIDVLSFDIYMDPTVVDQQFFDTEISLLSVGLSELFKDKSAREYENNIRQARLDGKRYLLIQKQVTNEQRMALRELPIFNKDRMKGGLIEYQEMPNRNEQIRDLEEQIISIKKQIGRLDSTYMQNKLKSNVYEFKNEKLTFYIYCYECLSFDHDKDDIQIIREMDNLFLMINEESKILIEEGVHDFQFE